MYPKPVQVVSPSISEGFFLVIFVGESEPCASSPSKRR